MPTPCGTAILIVCSDIRLSSTNLTVGQVLIGDTLLVRLKAFGKSLLVCALKITGFNQACGVEEEAIIG